MPRNFAALDSEFQARREAALRDVTCDVTEDLTLADIADPDEIAYLQHLYQKDQKACK